MDPDGPAQPLDQRQQEQQGHDPADEEDFRLVEEAREGDPPQGTEGEQGDPHRHPQRHGERIADICLLYTSDAADE